ncbi:MAG TPA: hypothetical protein VGG33_25580 [Polyangia bacterium]
MKKRKAAASAPAVPSGGRRRAGSLVFVIALTGMTLGALGHVAVQAKTVEVALALGSERARHEELVTRRRRAEILLGTLKDPGRLMEEGRKRGMVATSAMRAIGPRAAGDLRKERP